MSKTISMVFSLRDPEKAFKQTYNALDTLIKNLPDRKRFVICCLSSTYEQLKKLPEAYFRGRWLYIDYKGTITFVKKVVVKRPSGYKTYKIQREPACINEDFVKKITEDALRRGTASVGDSEFVVKTTCWEDNSNDKND